MMENIIIQQIGEASIIALQSISKQTFFETFAAVNSEENMEKYLTESLSIEKLTAELSNPNAEFYFATLDNEVLGYLKVNFGAAQTELKDPNGLEIERIYVLKAYHGKKVGQLLFDKALAIAKTAKVNYVWLGVWEENHKAINFYQKNGFIEFDKHIFILGEEAQTDLMMKLELNV